MLQLVLLLLPLLLLQMLLFVAAAVHATDIVATHAVVAVTARDTRWLKLEMKIIELKQH